VRLLPGLPARLRGVLVRALLLLAVLLFTATPVMSQTYVTENITTEVTWTPAGSPYIIQNNINVQSTGSLTIQSTASEGVTVEFEGSYWLATFNAGVITAEGHPDHPVVFTSGQGSPSPGNWDWIRIASTMPSTFTHCVIEYGYRGLGLDGQSATISNCVIRDCSYSGIYCAAASPAISNCIIYDNTVGLWIADPPGLQSHPSLSYCDIFNNDVYAVRVFDYESPLVIIDAENVWWGTDVEGEIQSAIYDNNDDPWVYAVIDYDPWLHESPVEVSSWARVKAMFAE
jgi:hypothetical protein